MGYVQYLREAAARTSSASASERQHSSLQPTTAGRNNTDDQEGTLSSTSEDMLTSCKNKYAQIVTLEGQCIQEVSGQNTRDPIQLEALLKLHTQLLEAHVDFFNICLDPAASAELNDIIQRYTMPARLWQHGVEDFLDLLNRGPNAYGQKLRFIGIAEPKIRYCLTKMKAEIIYPKPKSKPDQFIEPLRILGSEAGRNRMD